MTDLPEKLPLRGATVTIGGRINRSTYYKEHAACPVCGSMCVEATTRGVFGDIDDNRARCECGWVGIVHDMVPGKTVEE